MKTILQITPSGVKTVDDYGDIISVPPVVMLHTCIDWQFDLRSEKRDDSGALERYFPALELITGWYFAIDRDYDMNTFPKLLATEGITLDTDDSKTVLHVPIPDTGTAGMVEDMGEQLSRQYTAEIGGFDADARIVVTWQFPVLVKNRIYSAGKQPAPPEITPPEYYTAIEVRSMLSGKADLSKVYQKEEIDRMIGNLENELMEI